MKKINYNKLWEMGMIDPFELAKSRLKSIGVKPTWNKVKKLGLWFGIPKP